MKPNASLFGQPAAADLPAHEARRLMDRIYRRQRYIYDFTRKYYLLGRDQLIDKLDVPEGGSVLELGCGTGRNLIAVARRYPGARLCGLDLSGEMLKTAAAAIDRAGLSAGTRLARADAANFDAGILFGEDRFDRVFVSYSLSMIPAWHQVVGAGLAVTRPGGSLHVVDFGMQEGLPTWFGAGLRRWLALFHVSPRDDMKQVMREIAGEHGATLQFRSLYRDYARYAVITSAN